VAGDAGEDISEPCLRIDVVHLRRDDQAVHGGGAFTAAIGTGEQPRLPSQSDAAQSAFGGIVRQANAAIVEEARKARPALEHVVHGLCEIAAARKLGPLGLHPGLEIGDERPTQMLTDGAAIVGALPVDATLDLEQAIDAPDGFDR
jgi:hypothetical protein